MVKAVCAGAARDDWVDVEIEWIESCAMLWEGQLKEAIRDDGCFDARDVGEGDVKSGPRW